MFSGKALLARGDIVVNFTETLKKKKHLLCKKKKRKEEKKHLPKSRTYKSLWSMRRASFGSSPR